MANRVWFLLGLIALFQVGCGSPTGPKIIPVSGTVKYKDAPVVGATVSFSTATSARTAIGITDANGKFKLTTINSNDGAVAGEHDVSITKAPPKEGSAPTIVGTGTPEDYMKMMEGSKTGAPPGTQGKGKGDIPSKYSNAARSGLKRTVVAGEQNDFLFELVD
jgi:hypothetical protein